MEADGLGTNFSADYVYLSTEYTLSDIIPVNVSATTAHTCTETHSDQEELWDSSKTTETREQTHRCIS